MVIVSIGVPVVGGFEPEERASWGSVSWGKCQLGEGLALFAFFFPLRI